MVEMKSAEVVLSLAAQLVSWRAVLFLIRTWATCKPCDFHQYSLFLADCLNQSKKTVWDSPDGGAAATESRKVGKGCIPFSSRMRYKLRRKTRYADVDGPGAKPEPELGPHGPTLKKQVLRKFDWFGLPARLGLQPADSVDNSSEEEFCLAEVQRCPSRPMAGRGGPPMAGRGGPPMAGRGGPPMAGRGRPLMRRLSMAGRGGPPMARRRSVSFHYSRAADDDWLSELVEALDPTGSPSTIPKVADTTCPSLPSPSPPTVAGWWSFFCGK